MSGATVLLDRNVLVSIEQMLRPACPSINYPTPIARALFGKDSAKPAVPVWRSRLISELNYSSRWPLLQSKCCSESARTNVGDVFDDAGHISLLIIIER